MYTGKCAIIHFTIRAYRPTDRYTDKASGREINGAETEGGGGIRAETGAETGVEARHAGKPNSV